MSDYMRGLAYNYAAGTGDRADALLRQEEEDSRNADTKREAKRYTPHSPRVGLLGPNFCETCGSNTQLHQTIPYGERSTP